MVSGITEPIAFQSQCPQPLPVRLASGETIMYVMGGRSRTGTILNTVVAYNPTRNAWSTKAPMPARRWKTNGAVAINGKIYVSGGINSVGDPVTTLFLYNPVAYTDPFGLCVPPVDVTPWIQGEPAEMLTSPWPLGLGIDKPQIRLVVLTRAPGTRAAILDS